MADSEDVASQAWIALPGADKAALVRRVLHEHSRLDSAIRVLSDYRKAEASATARQSINEIRDFFSAFLATPFYTEQHAPGASKRPHRIWKTTDLVEYMLSFVEVADLFTLRQVNKILRNAIDRSEILQYRTSRSTNLDGFYRSPFEPGSECSKLTGFTVEALFSCNTAMLGIEKPPGHFAVVLEVRFDPKYSKAPVPNTYYPYGAMYLAQPPPTEIDVFPNCCSRGTYSSTYSAHHQDPLNASMALGRLQPVGKVVSTTGLTVGHLYDAIERIREEHRICPHAIEITNHDEDGNYWPDISFGCLLKVRPDDPILSPRIAAGVMSRTPPPAPNWRIWDYIDAKQKAHAAGRRIPTLAEFEASMRLENFRPVIPEESVYSEPNPTNMEYTWHHVNHDPPVRRPSTSRRGDKRSIPRLPSGGTTTSGTSDTSRPSTSEKTPSTIDRLDGNQNSRAPTSGRVEELSAELEHTIVVTPKKSKALLQHHRDDSRIDTDRPNTAKRKKV